MGARFLLCFGLLGLALSCYRLPEGSCALPCGPGGECPSPSACGADRFCHAPGDSDRCGADGGHDGGADAGPDAGPDAGSDAGACPGQLLTGPNATFDDGTLADWVVFSTIGSVDPDAHQGPFAARLCPKAGEAQVFISTAAVDGSPLSQGAAYRASGWAKGVPGADGYLKLRELSSVGAGAVTVNTAEQQQRLDGGWQHFELTYTVFGDASVRVNIAFTASPADAGCLNVDDVCFSRVK